MKYLIAPALALTLAGCGPTIDVFTSEAEAKTDGGGGKSRERQLDDIYDHCEGRWRAVDREYGVFATDDSPVPGPGLADILFDCHRFSSGPYHNYCEENRAKGLDFRVGHIPDDALSEGIGELRITLEKAARQNGDDLRVALIFTGPRFYEQLEDEAESCLSDYDRTPDPLEAFDANRRECNIGLLGKKHHELHYTWTTRMTRVGPFYSIRDNETDETVGMLVNRG